GWCTVLTEDWWTYEVCYEKEVQQYHAEDGKVLTAYHLGYYQPDDEASVETLTLHGKGTKFLAQQYVNGSDCELAPKQRSTEVRYTCGQDDKSIIQSVREVESCSYVVTILTPLLCAHDDFVSVEPPPQEIHCRQLPDSAPSPDAHMSGAGVPGLNREQVEKAAKALLTYAQKKGQESSNLLLDDELIYLNIALKKVPQTPRKDKPVRLNIPHPIYSLEGAEGHKASKKKVKEEQIAGVTKVVGLSKLRYGTSGIREGFGGGRLLWKQQPKGTYHPDLSRTKYESHEAKRKLCNSYDLFLADERVLGSLPKLIGKSFFKKKKQPVPVKLVGKDWSGHISKAVKATYFFWTGAVVENVIAALKDALPHIPKQWNGVKALYMKTADSVALPIYQASPVPDVVRIKA
ncbi:hypothetical protein APUTEX25_003532, partial [Auxenochlorella protothecoides]